MAGGGTSKEGAAKERTLTQRDLELLAISFKCMKGECVIDYAKFATHGGFKNSNSSKAAWHNLKKKVDALGAAKTDDEKPGDEDELAGDEDDESAAPAADTEEAPVKKSAGTKRKTKDADDEDQGADGPPPTKTKKPRGRAKKEVKEETLSDPDDFL